MGVTVTPLPLQTPEHHALFNAQSKLIGVSKGTRGGGGTQLSGGTLLSPSLSQVASSAPSKCASMASSCAGEGVSRSRSVPRGTVGKLIGLWSGDGCKKEAKR